MVKLFVGNVADKVTNDDLRGLFEPFGAVSQADILQGRGYGFVHMDNRQAAEGAIARLDNTEFLGKKIHVELSTSSAASKGGPARGGGSGGGPMRGGRGGGSAGRDFDRRGGDRDFDRRGGGREMRGGGGRDLPQRGGGRDGHFTRGDMGPPARSRYENGGGSMRGGGGGAPMPPPPDRDPMYERELVMRDPLLRERLLREYERLLAIDRFDMVQRSTGSSSGGGGGRMPPAGGYDRDPYGAPPARGRSPPPMPSGPGYYRRSRSPPPRARPYDAPQYDRRGPMQSRGRSPPMRM